MFTQAAGRLHLQTVVVAKDCRVCWILGRLFARPEWDAALVFKGGTALSKVFGLIRRFSAQVDLSVSPATLGISESAVEGPGVAAGVIHGFKPGPPAGGWIQGPARREPRLGGCC